VLISRLVTLTLAAHNDVNDSNDQVVQSFADRLKVSHGQKKPSALEEEDEKIQAQEVHAARSFQVRMTQTVARRR